MFDPALRCSVLALCCLIPTIRAGAAPHPVSLISHQPTDLAGTYQGHAPANDAARRVFTLDLATDGTATLTTLFLGKDNAKQSGRWARTGSQITLTFDATGSNRPPAPITFRHRDHSLSPVHWDPSEWGRSGPPVLHWSHSRAKLGGA